MKLYFKCLGMLILYILIGIGFVGLTLNAIWETVGLIFSGCSFDTQMGVTGCVIIAIIFLLYIFMLAYEMYEKELKKKKNKRRKKRK